ncbi:MAG: DUF4932 domain-containing protein [Bacteroidota bacterium]
MKKKTSLVFAVLAMCMIYLPYVHSYTDSKAQVYVHEPVELLYTIYHLTPAAKQFIRSTKRQRDWVDAMIEPLMRPFQSYGDHPAVQAMIALGEQYSIWLPTLTNVGVQNRELPLQPLRYTNTDNPELEMQLRAFIELANQFAKDTKFRELFAERRPIYSAIEKEVQDHMPDATFFETMESFYQKQFHSYNLCPSPLLPAGNGMGFGPNWKEGDKVMIFNVFSGVTQPNTDPSNIVKADGHYGYPAYWVRDMSAHEFGHSFVNAPLFQYTATLKKYEHYLKPIKKKMKRQGYWNWNTVMAEHLVRLGEIRIADRLGMPEDSRKKLYYNQVDRHFIYLPHLLKVMQQYENNEAYATFESFIPVLLDSLAELDVKAARQAWKKEKRKRKKA